MNTKSTRRAALPSALLLAAAALPLAAAGCVIDSGPDYGGGCWPDLSVPWEIQDSTGSPVTCDQAGASSVVALVDGTTWSVPCPAGQSQGTIDVPLESDGMYNVAVDLYDQNNKTLVPELTLSPALNVTNCGPNQTMTAVLTLPASSSGQ